MENENLLSPIIAVRAATCSWNMATERPNTYDLAIRLIEARKGVLDQDVRYRLYLHSVGDQHLGWQSTKWISDHQQRLRLKSALV